MHAKSRDLQVTGAQRAREVARAWQASKRGPSGHLHPLAARGVQGICRRYHPADPFAVPDLRAAADSEMRSPCARSRGTHCTDLNRTLTGFEATPASSVSPVCSMPVCSDLPVRCPWRTGASLDSCSAALRAQAISRRSSKWARAPPRAAKTASPRPRSEVFRRPIARPWRGGPASSITRRLRRTPTWAMWRYRRAAIHR